MEVVLDASVAILALADWRPPVRDLRRRLAADACHAPHLIDAQVGSGLRKQVRAERLDAAVAAGALRTLSVLVVRRHPHGRLMPVAWALRHTITFYDALYVALAAHLGCPLLTTDARLARAPGLPCTVELVARPTGDAAPRDR